MKLSASLHSMCWSIRPSTAWTSPLVKDSYMPQIIATFSCDIVPLLDATRIKSADNKFTSGGVAHVKMIRIMPAPNDLYEVGHHHKPGPFIGRNCPSPSGFCISC